MWLNLDLLPWATSVRGGIRYDYAINDRGDITMGFMENVTAADLHARAQGHRAEATRLEAEAARIEQAMREHRTLRRFRPVSPLRPDEGASPVVITFTRSLSGRRYHYAAVGWADRRSGRGSWSVTGEESGRFTWAELLAFIEAENWRSIAVVTHQADVEVRDTSGKGGKYTWAGADAKAAAERAAADVPQASPFRAQEHRPAAAESMAGHQAPHGYSQGGAVAPNPGRGLGDFDGCGNDPY
ncbi:hypothetical protein SEA_BIGGITYBASS_76 [Gordonia phage BiggityBass]|nr:hypothetical protein SEA_BIGGITYBASS_76 [Gordonia phage BiggityBass]